MNGTGNRQLVRNLGDTYTLSTILPDGVICVYKDVIKTDMQPLKYDFILNITVIR